MQILWGYDYVSQLYFLETYYFSSQLFELFLYSTFQCFNHIWAPMSFFISLTCETQTLIHYYYTQLMSSWKIFNRYSVQFSSVAQSCPTLCDPMNRSTPGLPVHHHLLEFIQAHVHRVSDAIRLSHPLSSPSPPAPNPSQHQSLFQWVISSHEVAKVLEFQL